MSTGWSSRTATRSWRKAKGAGSSPAGRAAGRPHRRIRREPGDSGWFGLFDEVDDEEVAVALGGHLPGLAGRAGCTTIAGPPAPAGPYADPELVLSGPGGAVVAVRDLAAHLRGAGPRPAWGLGRRAHRRRWDTETIVRVFGDPAILVPARCAVASDAGHRWFISPGGPDDRPPETIHRLDRGAA